LSRSELVPGAGGAGGAGVTERPGIGAVFVVVGTASGMPAPVADDGGGVVGDVVRNGPGVGLDAPVAGAEGGGVDAESGRNGPGVGVDDGDVAAAGAGD
jgi:hypothetical protein